MNIKPLFVFLSVCVLAGCFRSTPPKDKMLFDAFTANKATFVELLAFSEQHPNISRIGPDFTYPSDTTEIGVSAQELASIRAKMRSVGCRDGLVRTFGSPGPRFIFMAGGLVTGGVMKGIIHMKAAPNRVESTLDEFGWSTTSPKEVYRQIEGEWYVFFERS